MVHQAIYIVFIHRSNNLFATDTENVGGESS